MNDEYIIINKSVLEKRIAELKDGFRLSGKLKYFKHYQRPYKN